MIKIHYQCIFFLHLFWMSIPISHSLIVAVTRLFPIHSFCFCLFGRNGFRAPISHPLRNILFSFVLKFPFSISQPQKQFNHFVCILNSLTRIYWIALDTAFKLIYSTIDILAHSMKSLIANRMHFHCSSSQKQNT